MSNAPAPTFGHASDRTWVRQAVMAIQADLQRSADTHLIRLDLPEFPDIDVYLKDESIHPSGSLKHRLARSLFLHAICNGDLREGMTVVEASSGSTAISEAFFARLVGLAFIAVVPASTAPAKLAAIEAAGGKLRLAQPGEDASDLARALAGELGGHFVDQFTNAERATDWRGNNNIAESLFAQMGRERFALPSWIVVGAGTGGTSATIGRYIRYRPDLAGTRLCVVDPPGSAFFPAFSGQPPSANGCSGVTEGIGRPRVEPSFMAQVVDRMVEVPDAASVAAVRWLAKRTGRRFGPSTGTNLVGVLALATRMRAQDERGSIVTLACDSGERYADTVYDDAWLSANGLDIGGWSEAFGRLRGGEDGPFPSLRMADRRLAPYAAEPSTSFRAS
ncbi:MAG: PLP-dependent cysteine synthase family protein [Alphaproteobacteria bacterium]|nr:PLP-dependent cysteine synthase family protein [Alphaproteobacteria bacterium]